MIIMFLLIFKNNLIRYDTNNGYTILDDSIKDIVGFFFIKY